MLHVLLDTSVLKAAPWQNTALTSLLMMAKAGAVKVYLPDTVYHERRTQWREDYGNSLSKAVAQLKKLEAQKLLSDDAQAQIAAAIEELDAVPDPETLSHQAMDRLFSDVARIQLTGEQMKAAMDAYFLGSAPFPTAKSRNDIPDALVYLAAKNILESGQNIEALLCACNDENLAKHLAQLERVKITSSLDELLHMEELKNIEKTIEPYKAWAIVKDKIDWEEAQEEVFEYISENVGHYLMDLTVYSEIIPDDNNEARIQYHDTPIDMEVTEIRNYENGLIDYVVSFQVDVSLYFSVFRSNAYDLPDWISVHYGDPEEDSFFEAEGERRLQITWTIAATASVENVEAGEHPIFDKLALEGSRAEVIVAEF